jgi:hypothetical protein
VGYLTRSGKIARIELASKENKCVRVVCIGMICLDKDLDDLYVNINALPDWVKNKLALLQMIDVGEGLDDTGRHIAKNVFWVQN